MEGNVPGTPAPAAQAPAGGPAPVAESLDRILAASGIVLALVAAVTLLLPWHEVVTPDLAGALCWVPDCHPSPNPQHSACTGLAHLGLGPLPLLLLLAVAALEALLLAPAARPFLWPPILVQLGTVVVLLLEWNAMFRHLLENTEDTIFGLLYHVALFGLLGVAFGQSIRARRLRRRLAPPAGPGPAAGGARRGPPAQADGP